MEGRILVTGGLGFIGSAFIRRVARNGRDVLNVDAGTYASDAARLEGIGPDRVRTEKVDVAEEAFLDLASRERQDVIVHFAAESHVHRSEDAAEACVRTDVTGTGR